MGVCRESIEEWERGKDPSDRMWPRVISFLGYDPTPDAVSMGDRLRARRRAKGLSRKAVAKRIRCDERQITKWESNEAAPSDRDLKRLKACGLI